MKTFGIKLKETFKGERMWIDVHTHLHMLKKPLEEIFQQAKESDVQKMITIGTQLSDWDLVLESCKRYSVYGALGCHPHEAKTYTTKVEEQLKGKIKSHKNIIALGEIGLDYYYEHSQKEIQKEAFRKQLSLAQELSLPVEIHSRSAEEDTLSILKEFPEVKGLLHCFTSSWNMAQQALDIGYNISFSGIITFKNAQELRDICSKVPLDRLHVETDAPYLAPSPYRGRENQPAWMVHTAQVIADLHKVSLDQLKKQTWQNACDLFSLKV